MKHTTEWESIDAEDKRLRALDARRAARRKYLSSLPTCRVCGGRIVGGQCTGDGVIRCGLHSFNS